MKFTNDLFGFMVPEGLKVLMVWRHWQQAVGVLVR